MPIAKGNTKPCSSCKVVKPLSDFSRHPYKKDGLEVNCKSCHRESVREYAKSEKGKENDSRKAKRMREKYPEKFRAREKLRYAVRSGKIERPTRCDNCGTGCITHGHHEDYSKPYDVDWLCEPCHKHRHNKLTDLSLLSPVRNTNTSEREDDD